MTPDRGTLSSGRISETGTTTAHRALVVPWAGTWRLVGGYVSPHATLAASGTNYRTLAVKKGSTTLASLDSSATAFTLDTPRAYSLTGTGKDLEVAQGSAFLVDLSATGTGGTIDCDVVLELEKLRV